ncbi:MAG: AAA family ATPase [Firmicutes bacterium]|nr:AAA family ATPase [Bacillota bacterium]
MEAVLRFAHNNSVYLERVLALAGQAAAARHDEPNGIYYRLTFPRERFSDLFAALEYAKNWESTTLEVEGRVLNARQLREVVACPRAGLKAEDPRAYCRGGWPGRLFPCRAIRVDESDEHGWFRFGRLEGEVFIVDKEKIARTIRLQLAEGHYDLCPLLRPEEIESVLSELPATIDPRRDPGWDYRHDWVKGRLVPVGVQKTTATGAKAKNAEGTPRLPAQPREGRRRYVPEVTYAEIGGLKEQLNLIRETVELPLRHPEVFQHLGITPNRGVLLWGPPGTGKTLIAKAVANQCRAHLAIVRGPEVKSKWHGQSESNLREIFDEARENAPAIILFDEIDALVPNRDTLNHDVNVSIVSQLLTLMDGIEERGQVVIIGTTNRPEAIDPAFRRPGRFDLEIEIGLPDDAALREILAIHTARMPLAEDVCLDRLVPHLRGLTGADVAALCKEAALVCLRERLRFERDDLVLQGTLEEMKVSALHFERALQTLQARREGPAANLRLRSLKSTTNRR